MGKTHLVVALTTKAIENSYGAYFARAYDLIEDLPNARAGRHLGRPMRIYQAPKGGLMTLINL